jgi:quercetin dioxygenase-like cupin family protein
MVMESTHAPRWVVTASLALLVLPASGTWAQDAVTAAPALYTVEFENEQVRVVRAVYGPLQKSAMHEHPDCVAVYLTDGHIRITLPDGRTGEPFVKAGQSMWHPAGKHAVENLGSTPFELVLTELKIAPKPLK